MISCRVHEVEVRLLDLALVDRRAGALEVAHQALVQRDEEPSTGHRALSVVVIPIPHGGEATRRRCRRYGLGRGSRDRGGEGTNGGREH